MKKHLPLLGLLIVLTACERPATFSNWSPINDAVPPTDDSQIMATLPIPSTNIFVEISPTPYPTLDSANFPAVLPASLKGFDLMSWQVGDAWNFTLVTGTNREKTFEELMAPDSSVDENGFVKITVSGIEQIKKVIDRLPAKSQVFWGGMDLAGQVPEGTLYFAFPPQDMMDELIAYAKDLGVDLVSLKEPE